MTVVDNQIDQMTGTVKLKSTFSNANLTLWPGQFVNVRLMLDTIYNAVVTPSTAVQRGPSGAFVYVLGADGAAHMRPVTTGRQDENIVVVTSGLEAGTTVITSGFSRLSDGAIVRLANVEEPASGSPAPRSADENGRGRRDRGARSEETLKR